MILFKESMVPLILNGTKTVTRRRGKCRWRVGAIHQCYTRPAFARPPGKPFARVRIVSVTQQTWPGQSVLRPVHATIGARREHDRREAILEGFPSWHDFCEAYRKINGEASWGDPCWRVEFIVVDTKGAVR